MVRVKLIILSLVFFSCGVRQEKSQNSIIVYCAASMYQVLSELSEAYGKENIDTKVIINPGASGTLARQIENGAPAGIFISANKKWVDYLTEKKLCKYSSICKLASNQLTVIASNKSEIDLSFSKEFANSFNGYLAIGNPEYVPAGNYGKHALESIGCYCLLENRIIPAKDVSSVLRLVELGEVELGMVYRTDAIQSQKVKIICDISNQLTGSIASYVSICNGVNDNNDSSFYNFIRSDEAKKIWRNYGFGVE